MTDTKKWHLEGVWVGGYLCLCGAVNKVAWKFVDSDEFSVIRVGTCCADHLLGEDAGTAKKIIKSIRAAAKDPRRPLHILLVRMACRVDWISASSLEFYESTWAELNVSQHDFRRRALVNLAIIKRLQARKRQDYC